jgi:hypothetical protein
MTSSNHLPVRRLRSRPQIWQDGQTMGTANLYLGVAWLGLGGFLLWDAWQSGSGRLELLLGGVCILVAIGNFVFWNRLRPKP